MTDDYCVDSVHPPNVVLVNSNQTSPEHQPTPEICSPLSTAPNSPYAVSYEEDEEEDDDDGIDEVRPEEIQELLDTPVSSKRNIRGVEVPFDEGGNTPKSSETEPKTTTTIDPLLGSKENNNPALVSPINTSIQEDIDAYEDEEEEEEEDEDDDDDDRHDEKKEDSTPPTPARPPVYSGYSSNSASKKINEYSTNYPRVVPLTNSEDDSVPHDERQFRNSSAGKEDFIENARRNADHNEDQSPMKEALQSAEREVQEMERRVQQMIEKRRSSFDSTTSPQQQQQEQQQRTGLEQEEPEILSINNHYNNKTQSIQESDRPVTASTAESPIYDLDEEEPPSLSPRRDVHSSVDSGNSSYYYDGSAMGSSTTDDPNNTTLESTTSSAIGGTTRVGMSIHPPLVEAPPGSSSSSKIGSGGGSGGSNNKNLGYYSRLTGSNRSTSALESSREETAASSSADLPRFTNTKMDATSSYETFTSRKDQEKSTNSSFASLVSGTRSALNQVTDDLASFLVLPPEKPLSASKRSKRSSKKSYVPPPPPPDQEYPPISPSQDSDGTPHMDNLSPRRPISNGDGDMDLLYRQRPSAKLTKARSLVSGRQYTKSPTTAPYMNSNGNKNNNSSSSLRIDDFKQRARQVMNKREKERPASFSRRSERASSSSRGSRPRSSNDKQIDPPLPPTLYNFAAMMEGLGGGSAEDNIVDDREESEADWPNSVSQIVQDYQTAITDSLRNLSMDESSGLAQNGEQIKIAPEFGRDTMVSPGVSLTTARNTTNNDINSFSNLKDEAYDALMQEMTFGACLQMPELDHPPIMTTRNNSTAQQPKIKDYEQGVAGVLQYNNAGLEYQYHSHSDEQQPRHDQLAEDPEHQERADFAKQLSERLMCLGPDSSMNSGGSLEDRYSSPQKLSTINGTSFDSKDSSFAMSPPKRGGDANKDTMMTKIGGSKDHQGGLFVSNLPRNGDLPHSGQPSVSSEGNPTSTFATPDRDTRRSREKGKNSTGANSVAESISDIKPTMVQNIDNETGIPKGDVMLSLLCDNSFQASQDKPDSWAWRVQESIWRGRAMRRECAEIAISRSNSQDDGDGRQGRRSSSLPVDVDDVRVVGGIRNVSSIQDKALAHLERDEFEEALELYEDIIFNYYSFFEQVLAKRDEFSSEDVSMELSNFKPYIGASLHNLGVIHLLKGDYEDAFSFFKRAVDNRRACLGEAHPDCVTSLVRLATCRFAMDNFAEAHTNLELSLALAGSKARTTNDYSQLGEILNNLGCLSYMCGQPTKAMKLFRESLDVQLAVLNSTLYGGSKYSSHTATLNLSVTRGNVGFLALVLRDVSSGILALEAALREQRLLLSGAHVTLVSTMDHLAVANLLEGRTQKAIKMLRRIYELQKAAHGPNDPRSLSTRQKIITIRGQQEDAQRDTPPRQQRRNEEEAKSSRSGGEQHEDYARQQQQQANASRQTGEAAAPSKGPNNNGGGGGGKVNSVFKAIRSLGRKKT